jgi:peptidoglycan/xylan/chitin deacetylase (PgdA/CDA1 family)
MSLERYVEDVEFANNILRTDLFRPPYGRITPAQAGRIGRHYNIIMWDIISRDYSNIVSPRACLRNVTNHVRGGSIVVFHDSQKAFRNLRYALPRTLDFLEKRGLQCSAINI